MCQEDNPTPPLDCCGSHGDPDAHLTELGFQIVYSRMLAAQQDQPNQEASMPSRAA